ncbi:MAG: hypothetical protein K0S27_1020, partial [Gammaproteobacteria bacterium]|nr:hypothetical protein [Gammaproteobacteria bacterium]
DQLRYELHILSFFKEERLLLAKEMDEKELKRLQAYSESIIHLSKFFVESINYLFLPKFHDLNEKHEACEYYSELVKSMTTAIRDPSVEHIQNLWALLDDKNKSQFRTYNSIDYLKGIGYLVASVILGYAFFSVLSILMATSSLAPAIMLGAGIIAIGTVFYVCFAEGLFAACRFFHVRNPLGLQLAQKIDDEKKSLQTIKQLVSPQPS